MSQTQNQGNQRQGEQGQQFLKPGEPGYDPSQDPNSPEYDPTKAAQQNQNPPKR